VVFTKSDPLASAAHEPLFCPSHIMTSYCVSITDQTTAKSYLFVLYNKKKTPELNRFYPPKHLEIWKSRNFTNTTAHMINTNKGMLLDKVLCDVIPCVCPLIDHGSWPMKALEFLTLLYKILYILDHYSSQKALAIFLQLNKSLIDFMIVQRLESSTC
jgi:hypothetical protein